VPPWLLRASLGRFAVAAAASVTLARARRGPLRPAWGFMDELVATGMKAHFARIEGRPWPEQRATFAAMAAPERSIRSVTFERASLGDRPAVWITPRDVSPRDEHTLLFLHGGAYLFGSAGDYLDLIARVACSAGVRAVAVDYRLAPEHPFPAALEDAVRAYLSLLASGVDRSRLVVAGDSAGGGLTASLLVALRDSSIALPAAAALLCPWVDMTARGGSLEQNEPFDVFTPSMIERWAETVLAGADPADPRASPILADLRGLPPILLQVGGAEMLLDQDVAFAEKARDAGVDVTLRVWDDCIHDWQVYAQVLESGRRAIEEIGEFVRSATRR